MLGPANFHLFSIPKKSANKNSYAPDKTCFAFGFGLGLRVCRRVFCESLEWVQVVLSQNAPTVPKYISSVHGHIPSVPSFACDSGFVCELAEF